MVYAGTYDCYENININSDLQKENDCKVELHFVNCWILLFSAD